MTIHPPMGPEGRHFAGHTFGALVLLSGGSTAVDRLEHYQALLALEPYEDVSGAVIRGRLTIDAVVATDGEPAHYRGDVPFEVVYRGAVRTPDADVLASPQARAGPFTVTLFERDFKPRSALANVVRDLAGKDVLADVVFYEAAGATCDSTPLGHAIDVELQSPTGADTRDGPQPTGSIYIRKRHASGAHEAESSWYPDGWFRLESLALEPGGRASGELVIHRALHYTGIELDPYVVAVSAAGRFDALVCHRGRAADWEQARVALP